VVNEPWALPATFKSPAQVALKLPLALVDVCSVTDHLKSVHELGDGIRLFELHVPISEPLPAALGPVSELFLSKPTQPEAATADIDNRAISIRFFMDSFSVASGRMIGPATTDEKEVYQPQVPMFSMFYG
jgi:hypothetical protein